MAVGDGNEAWKEYAINAKPDGFITALERIEFLAEGTLELSRQGVIPGSPDELRRELQARGFVQTLAGHGAAERLRAADEMFRIPWHGNPKIDRAPELVVTPTKPAQMTHRERKLNKVRPTPPTIATAWLKPRNLIVRWVRDFDTNTFSYEIEIRPPER